MFSEGLEVFCNAWNEGEWSMKEAQGQIHDQKGRVSSLFEEAIFSFLVSFRYVND